MKNFFRIISLFIISVMMIGQVPLIASSDGALPFNDVREDDWYYDSVKYVFAGAVGSS